MAKIWRTTLKQLIAALEELRVEIGDDVPVGVHGEDCVEVRPTNHRVDLVGFHAHSKSEMKLDAQGAFDTPMGGTSPWTGQPGDGF